MPGKKRTRAALKSLNLNEGSPEKKSDVMKPVRKASRSVSSTNSYTKNAAVEGLDDMVLDA